MTCRYCRASFPNPTARPPQPPPGYAQPHGYGGYGPQQGYGPQSNVYGGPGYSPPQVQITAPIVVGSAAGAMVYYLVTFVVLAVGAGAFWFVRMHAMGPGSSSWDGTKPYSCSVNENVSFKGVKATFAKGTAITAEGNCHVECVDCTIKAQVAARVNGNGHITFVNGTIEGTETSFDADGNGTIEASGDAVVKGTAKRSANGKVIGAPLWDGAKPFVCNSMLDNIEVSNVTAEFTTGNALEIGCDFTCNNCNIKAPTVVKVTGLGHARFVGGNLTGNFEVDGSGSISVSGNGIAKGHIVNNGLGSVSGVTETSAPTSTIAQPPTPPAPPTQPKRR